MDADESRLGGFRDGYQFVAPTRVVAGRSLIDSDSVGFELAKEGASRVLVVCDGVATEAGVVEYVSASLREGGVVAASTFSEVPPVADIEAAERAGEAARAEEVDGIVAVGGEAVLDAAKLAAVLVTHGGSPREWAGQRTLPRSARGRPEPLVPVAAVPTESGSGGESSPSAGVIDSEARLTLVVNDPALHPRLAVLDPQATAALPPGLLAASGMDAISHAVEGVISREWSPHADACGLRALRLLAESLEPTVLDPDDERRRGTLLTAANLAAMPAGHGATGLVTAMAHPLTARHGVPHALACAALLPVVLEWTGGGEDGDVVQALVEIADAVGLDSREPAAAADSDGGASLAAHVAAWARQLAARTELPSRLDVEADGEEASALAADALRDPCTLASPREPSHDDLSELYRQVL